MKIQLLAVGTKIPSWVTQGYQEYARRMPKECSLELIEIPTGQRGKNAPIQRIIDQEGKQLLAAIKPGNKVVALDVKGKSWSTEVLAKNMSGWLTEGQNISLLIGGPDGLSSECLQRADLKWSLSALTFPHPLVRVVISEQIYRAWSLLNHHPYHRA